MRFVRREVALLRALALLLTGRRDVAPDERAIGYSGPLVPMLVVLTVVDGIVAVLLHVLLPDAVQGLALVLGLVGVLWLAAFVASLVVLPHTVSATRLRLRFGVFQEVELPVGAVRSVSTTHAQPRTTRSAQLFDDELEMAVANQAGVVVELEPTAYRSLDPRVAAPALTRVVFHADDPREARRLLLAAAAEAHQGEGR
ncbi:hypothetical protein [Nocardioides solisilvae]|uniref:hypothetical protein n=1 Tax=Nocardioides solisilvae TaxID=1542435 RepID=UPI000D74ACA6|nr:hypothetical protein [Nocardioides solisilvae]